MGVLVTTVSFKKIEYCLQYGFILQDHLILRDLSSLSTSNFKIKVLFDNTHSPSLPNMQVPLPFWACHPTTVMDPRSNPPKAFLSLLYTLNATSTTLRVTRHCMKTSQRDANSRQIQGVGLCPYCMLWMQHPTSELQKLHWKLPKGMPTLNKFRV